jgi:hypothetical protein
MTKQLNLFDEQQNDIELQIEAILSRRRKFNCSGQDGSDVNLIRAALREKQKDAA